MQRNKIQHTQNQTPRNSETHKNNNENTYAINKHKHKKLYYETHKNNDKNKHTITTKQ